MAQMTSGLPDVRLEVRQGTTRPIVYEMTGEEFLIGSVPGCDLRLPGTQLPPVVPPNYFEVKGEGSTNGTKLGTAGTGPAGTMLLTSRQIDTAAYTGAAVAHENLPPTVYFWCLVKT